MQIKQNKLDNLAKLNIPSKYMGELKNKKVTFWETPCIIAPKCKKLCRTFRF